MEKSLLIHNHSFCMHALQTLLAAVEWNIRIVQNIYITMEKNFDTLSAETFWQGKWI